MKLSTGITLLAALLGGVIQAQQSDAPQPVSQSTFLVLYKPGPSWLPGKPVSEQPLREHGRYISSLYSKGELKIGGPFTDDAGGAAVLYAADERAARGIVMKDPAVAGGIFVYELHPWQLMDWERLRKSGKSASK